MPRFLRLIVLLLLPVTGSAQYWIRGGGGAFNDGPGSIAEAPGGDIVSCVWFSGFMNINSQNFTSAGGTDILLIKTNASGVIQWVQKFGGPGDDRGLSVAVDNAGNIAMSGFFSQSLTTGSVSLVAAGAQDAFVLKLDASGNALWGVSGGGPYNDAAVAVAFDPAGNLVSTGNFTGAVLLGSSSLNSIVDPVSGLPSQDVFIVSYGSNGTQQWLQQGGGKYADKAVGLVTDNNGNVYTTGQFSDTIQFVNQHPNTGSNSIYLVKFSSTGSEQWFTWAGGGGYSNVRGIACDGTSSVYLTGDCSGNIQFAGPPQIITSNIYSFRIFLTQYNLNGQPQWAETDGSSSPVVGGPVALDPSGNVYIAGTFRCVMNEYADQYGQGLFNSSGFYDVLVSKYNNAGTRIWSRQAGGSKDDEVTGLFVPQVDQPVLIGGYEERFVCAIDPASFQSLSGGLPVNSGNIGTFCNDANYGLFHRLIPNGGRDFYIGKFIDINRLPYDFYTRSTTACSFPQVGCCVSLGSGNNFCLDQTTVGCGGFNLYANTKTSAGSSGPNAPGPNFTFQWNTGSISRSILVNASGTYTATVTSEDGCYTSSDDITVVVNQIPSRPTITDNKFVNINSGFPAPIQVCAPDSVYLIATNVPSNATVQWAFNSTVIPGSSLTVVAPTAGNYLATVSYILPNGCASSTSVLIIAGSTVLPPSKPYIEIPDTITSCGLPIVMLLKDSLNGQPCAIPSLSSVVWTTTPSIGLAGSPPCSLMQSVSFTPGTAGTYLIEATIIRGEVCAGYDTIVVSKQITVQSGTPPVINATLTPNGNLSICPGSTITFTASGGTSYAWSNGQTTSSITVSTQGYYCVTVSKTDSSGCTAVQTICETVNPPVVPVIASAISPIVLCPGDSVLLVAVTKGSQYSWVGPMSITPNSDTLYANAPGTYYCNITDTTGCTLISNSIEVLQYFTPSLSAFPSPLFCQGDSVRLNVEAAGNETVLWNSPLSGTSSFQYVNQPGTYSCAVTSCGITVTASATVFASAVSAAITQQDTTLCFGDSLLLAPAPFSGVAIWFPDSIYSNQLMVSNSGTYYVQVTDPNGCSATSNAVIVNFDSVPRPLGILATTPLCEDEQLYISPILAGGSGLQWTGPAGFSSNQPDILIDSIKPNQGGFYVIEVTNGACSSIPDSIEIVVYAKIPQYSFTVSPACLGDTLSISTNPPVNYQFSWTSPAGLQYTDTILTLANFSAQQSGYYQLAVTNGTCPPYLDSVFVPLPSSGSVNVSAIDTTACVGESILVTAAGTGGSITWYPSGNTSANETVFNTGTVYCTLTDTAGCIYTSDSLELFFHLPPQVSGLAGDTVCVGDSLQLQPLIVPGSLLNLNYSWSGPLGFTGSAAGVLIYPSAIANSGTYNLQVSDGVCTSNATVDVAVVDNPSLPQVVTSIPDCVGKKLELIADGVGTATFIQPNGLTYFGDTLSVVITTFADTGFYYFNTVAGECASGFDSLFVTFDSCKVTTQDWYIPNIFTPNNDGTNEVFVPLLPFGEDGLLQIFNRWGDMLYSGKISEGWNGKDANGKEQASGTYYWLMYPEKSGAWVSKNGFVELIR